MSRPTELAHFEWFCSTYLEHSVDQFSGKPMILEEWQRDFMGEVLETVDGENDPTPYWRSCALVLPRKNGKTTLLAALALYRMFFAGGSPEILLAASSDRQAGRLFDATTAFLRRSPELADQVTVRDYIGEIQRKDGEGRILRMSSDPSRLHGWNPSTVIVDELAQWTTPNLRRAWAALTTGGGARRGAQTFTITTAGEATQRQTGILGTLIDGNAAKGDVEARGKALTISRNEAAKTLVFEYSAPTDDRNDLDAVVLANPATWIDREFLERQAANPELSDAEFLQLHANVWAANEDTFITPEQWKELEGPPVDWEGRTVSIGLDGSRTHDTTALAWASRAEDGKIDVGVKVFSVRSQAPHHVLHAGGVIDYEDVEESILALFMDRTIQEAAYDPRFLDRSADILSARLSETQISAVEPSSRSMRDALSALHRGVVEGDLRHDGDPVLLAHVTKAHAEWDDSGPRVRKIRQTDPIDALVALALAYWRESRRSTVAPWSGEW